MVELTASLSRTRVDVSDWCSEGCAQRGRCFSSAHHERSCVCRLAVFDANELKGTAGLKLCRKGWFVILHPSLST